MMPPTNLKLDCDVLIVGLGPVGATLAGLLGQYGLNVIAVDREAAPYPLPRAAVFDDEIMRIFQRLGLSSRMEAITRKSNIYEFRNGKGDVLLSFDIGNTKTVSGWAGGYMIHQPTVEAVLRDRLQDLPNVDVRLSHRLVALHDEADSVVADLASPDGPVQVSARYLVGCDGASSMVRELSGIALDDYDFNEPWLVIDTLVLDPSAVPDRSLQICDPERPTTCLFLGPGRHRWEFMLKPGETAEWALRDETIAALLKPWNVEGAVTLERKAVYNFHALVARNWRKDRVFLAGDAAHQMPPFAGQGMCSGLRDVVNLAWKLAWVIGGPVIGGKADGVLLDSYQIEREPHVRAIIDTAIAMGRMVCTLDPAEAGARDAGMLAQRAAGGAPVSIRYPDLAAGCLLNGSPCVGALFPQHWAETDQGVLRLDDVLGRDAWLIVDGDAPVTFLAGVQQFSLSDAILQEFAGPIRAWLTEQSVRAVLVRPDGHIFGTGAPDRVMNAFRNSIGEG